MKLWKVAVVVLSAVALVAVGMYFSIGVPNLAGELEESVAISKLQGGAGRKTMISYLMAVHAEWHPGISWESGNAYGAIDIVPQCAEPCGSAQVGFDHGNAACLVWGDVITAFREGRQVSIISR